MGDRGSRPEERSERIASEHRKAGPLYLGNKVKLRAR